MPIYLDRHDVLDEVTAEHVAQMHQMDIKTQKNFDCKGITYWFDENRKAGFCLIEAPNKEAIEEMHNMAHGGIPAKIIEVDEKIVGSFLGRLEDPKNSKNSDLNIINESAFRTLMVLRSVGGINGNSQDIDSDLSDLIEPIKKTISNYDGSIVRMNYQCLLVSFSSVVNAVDCSNKLINNFNSKSNKVKIGLNSGEPVSNGKKIFEDTIILAERLCNVVKGDVAISSQVKDLYQNENMKDSSKFKLFTSLNSIEEIFLTDLMNFIEKEWNNPQLKVADFSKVLGESNSQLYRKLKILTGKSLNSFLKEFRLQKALNLLNNKKGNISEIAYATGFSSPTYFSRCFKEYYQTLPSMYL